MEIMNNVEILLNYYINKEQHNRNEYIINDCYVYISLNLINYYHIKYYHIYIALLFFIELI